MTNETNKQKMHPYSQVLQWVAEGKEIEDYIDGFWSKCSYNAVLSCALHGAYFGKILEPQDFRLKPQRHLHQDLIDAFEKGAEIQMYIDCKWEDVEPQWATNRAYRIKPEPKPDVVQYVFVMLDCNEMLECSLATPKATPKDNLKVVFDGETKKIKSVEIIENKHD